MIHHKSPPLLRSLLIMLLSGVAIVVLSLLAMDEICYRDTLSRQPLYPGAEIVSEEYDFLRARGAGITTLVLQTDADRETLRAWLRERNIELLRANRFRGISALTWGVHPPRENVPEGRLVYISSCGV